MTTREPAFASADEEREYGHRKLGRLLLGRAVDEVMRGRGTGR